MKRILGAVSLVTLAMALGACGEDASGTGAGGGAGGSSAGTASGASGGATAGSSTGGSSSGGGAGAGAAAGGSAGSGGGSGSGAGSGGGPDGGAGDGNGGGAGEGAGGGACQRPAGVPAVTLTYDDSLASQLSIAAPALKKHGLKGTFFIQDVRSNQAPWRALREEGHELGSHTFKHPCPKVNSWVPPGDASEDYDDMRMAKELDDSISLLTALGQSAPFTFAYPCGVDWIGNQQTSYAPLVAARFSAARGVSSGLVRPGVNLMNVPATFSTGNAAALIAIADGAKMGAAWVVFGFHGVGGDHTPVSAEAHEALLAHLTAKPGEFYVGTFGELAACMAEP